MCTIRPVEECHTVPRPVTQYVSIPAEEPKCQNVVEVQAVSCGAGLVNHRIAQREADAKPEADAFYGARIWLLVSGKDQKNECIGTSTISIPPSRSKVLIPPLAFLKSYLCEIGSVKGVARALHTTNFFCKN